MKLTFQGWSRTVYPHRHKVAPTSGPSRLKFGAPLKWSGPMLARGRVNGLALTGDFQVDFEFTPSELKNWLAVYLEKEPEKALALIAKVQLEAMKKLLKASDKATTLKK